MYIILKTKINVYLLIVTGVSKHSIDENRLKYADFKHVFHNGLHRFIPLTSNRDQMKCFFYNASVCIGSASRSIMLQCTLTGFTYFTISICYQYNLVVKQCNVLRASSVS